MSNYIIDVRVSGGTDVSPSGSAKSGTGAGGLLEAGGKLGLIAGAAMAMLSVLKEMLWVFKPVQNLLKGIMRTLGLFLQPIAELLFLLVKPLLDFIRPLAMLFRAMMMPVMNILRQYSAVMSQQMASGDYAGATQTGVDMIGLALGGFFISMANVLGQVLISLVGNLLSTLATSLIDGLYTLVRPLLDVFLGDAAMAKIDASVASLNDKITTGFDNGIAFASQALTNGTGVMMDGLVGYYTAKLETLKSTIEIGAQAGIVAPLENVVTNTADSIAVQTSNLQVNTNSSLNLMQTDVNTMMGLNSSGSIPNQFQGGLTIMKTAINVFVDDAVDAGNKIASALRKAQSASKNITQIGLININNIK